MARARVRASVSVRFWVMVNARASVRVRVRDRFRVMINARALVRIRVRAGAKDKANFSVRFGLGLGR